MLSISFLGAAASAESSSGKTANGCTYQVINGQYVANCPASSEQEEMVDVEGNPTPPPSNIPAPKEAPQQVVSPSLPRSAAGVTVLRSESEFAEGNYDSSAPKFYLGAGLGTAFLTDAERLRGNTMAFGLQIGADLNDVLGLEFGYSYQSQDLFLGLESRANGQVITPQNQTQNRGTSVAPTSNIDSTLRAHVFALESQFHLTERASTFRPFAGVGLAIKQASLVENFPSGTSGETGSSVSQTSFSLAASVGAKVRLAENLQIVGLLRLLLPITSSTPSWDVSTTSNSQRGANPSLLAPTPRQNLFRTDDTRFTSASLAQILLAVQYVF